MQDLAKKRWPVALLAAFVSPAFACDLCSVYTAQLADGQGAEGWYVGVAEQYTRYDELREGGDRIPDGGQFLKSSITQLVLGYGIDSRWAVQASLPYIDRRFKRPEGTIFERGSETGIGDASLIAQYMPYRHDDEDSTFTLRLLAGLEFGSGDSDRLREELSEDEDAPGDDGGVANGIHGHDLALGSGSTDLILGGTVFARQGRWVFSGNAQYTLRSQGDIDYEFGDDLQWSLGIGRYLRMQHAQTVSLQVVRSGEHKAKDTLAGEKVGDTRLDAVYLGPRLQTTFGTRWSVELGVDLPISVDVSEIQISPGWRARSAVVLHF